MNVQRSGLTQTFSASTPNLSEQNKSSGEVNQRVNQAAMVCNVRKGASRHASNPSLNSKLYSREASAHTDPENTSSSIKMKEKPLTPTVLVARQESCSLSSNDLTLPYPWEKERYENNPKEALCFLMGICHKEYDEIGRGEYSKVYSIPDSSGQAYAVKIFNRIKQKGIQKYQALDNGEGLAFKGNGHTSIPHTYAMLIKNTDTGLYRLINDINQIAPDNRNNYQVAAVISQKINGLDAFDALHGDSERGIERMEGLSQGSQTAIRVGKQMAEALLHYHQQNVIFRDLKPENILIEHETQKAFLIDPGFAKTLKEGQFTDTHCGTLDYYAPELRLRGNKYDYRLDAWTLGVLLMELTCRYTPAYYDIENDCFDFKNNKLTTPTKLIQTERFAQIDHNARVKLLISSSNKGFHDNIPLADLVADLLSQAEGRETVKGALERLNAM